MGGLFVIIIAGIVADTIVKVFKARSGGNDATKLRAELKEVTRQIQDQAGSLADAHATLASQDMQLQELQERLDFTERILTQERQRPGLGAGPAPGS